MAEILKGGLDLSSMKIDRAKAAQAAAELKDTLIEINSASYDKAAAYVSVVIFGAYASFFALWGLTKDLLPPRAVGLTALLMGISVLSFVLFEVFKMIVLARHFMSVSGLISGNLPAEDFLRAHEAAVQRSRTFGLKTVVPIWALSLVVSLGTGLPAAAILLWYFVQVALLGSATATAAAVAGGLVGVQ